MQLGPERSTPVVSVYSLRPTPAVLAIRRPATEDA